MAERHVPRTVRGVCIALITSCAASLAVVPAVEARQAGTARVAVVRGLPTKPVVVHVSASRAADGGERAITWSGLRIKLKGRARPKGRMTVVTERRLARKKAEWERIGKTRATKRGKASVVVRGRVDRSYDVRVVVTGRGLRTYTSPATRVTITSHIDFQEPQRSRASGLTEVPGSSIFVYDLPAAQVAPSVFVDRIGVFDAVTGSMQDLDQLPAGVIPNGHVARPNLSPDGRYLAFYSNASNLTADADHNAGGQDAYVKDLTTGVVERVNLGGWGTNWVGTRASSSSMYFTPDSRTLVLSGGDAAQQVWTYDLASGVGRELFHAGCTMSPAGLTPDGTKAFLLANDGATIYSLYVDLDDLEVHRVPFAAAGDTAPYEKESYTNVNAWPLGDDLAVVKTWRDEDWSLDAGSGHRWSLWRPSTGEVVNGSQPGQPGSFARRRYFLGTTGDGEYDTAVVTVPTSGLVARVPLDLTTADDHLVQGYPWETLNHDLSPSGEALRLRGPAPDRDLRVLRSGGAQPQDRCIRGDPRRRAADLRRGSVGRGACREVRPRAGPGGVSRSG